MFCAWCGCELFPDAVFCHNCGRRVSEGVSEGVRAPEEQSPVQEESVPVDDGIVNPIVTVCIFLSIVGMAVIFLPFVHIDLYSGSGYVRTVDYSGAYLAFSAGSGGVFEGFGAAGRVLPAAMAVAYAVLAFLFWRGLTYRPSPLIPIVGAAVFFMALGEAAAFSGFADTYGVYSTDPVSAYGLVVAMLLPWALMVLGYAAETRARMAGRDEDPLLGKGVF